MVRPPSILTIAGSDTGGGAGIQADMKTITVLGGYGLSVITALTAQNTRGVTAIEAPTPGFVAKQLETVLEDISVHAAKTGMLFSAQIIEAIVPLLEKADFPLVVDPVCVSQSGHRLLQEDAVVALKERMLPLADLLTPNKPEAELLTGMTMASRSDLLKCLEALLAMGPKSVLLKGGHFSGPDMVDWLALQDSEPKPLPQRRVDTPHTHGTGCTLSAAIATHLGFGLPLEESVRRAQAYLNLALRTGYRLGGGDGPPNHLAPLKPLQDNLGVTKY